MIRKISHPGVTLLELLQDHSMTQEELAKRTGQPLKTINEIIEGKGIITPGIAMQLEETLGASADFWIRREANYRYKGN